MCFTYWCIDYLDSRLYSLCNDNNILTRTRISELESEKGLLLRQKSVTIKEDKTEDKSRIQKGSHKLIEEEKAEIGNVSLLGFYRLKCSQGSPL